MQTTLASRRAAGVRPAAARSRSTTVRVVAWKGDNKGLFAGLLRMFAPNAYIDTKDTFTEAGFSGKIDRTRKPFKDGFIKKLTKEEIEAMDAAQKEQEGESAMDYLNNAAERVVKHNFTGEESEPDWKKLGSRGFKGDIRKHGEDGFHSRKL